MPLCGWITGRNWRRARVVATLCAAARDMRPVVLWCRVPVLWEFGPGSRAATSLVTGSVPIPLGRLLQPSPLPRSLPQSIPCHPIVESAVAKHQRKKSPAEQQLPAQLHAVNVHAAGIDVGAEAHGVAVPVEADPQPVRAFPALARESTGVSWIPLCELLETQGFEVIRVDPGTMPKNGRPQTDVHDGQWLQRLHTLGLLSAAFRPDDPVVVLRSSLRLRLTLVADAARHMQHMQKALTQMHSTLPHVVSDMTGVTGLRIIKAMLHGERDPRRRATLRDPRCKEDETPIAQALHGTWREEHLFALHQAVAAYEFCHQHIQEGDAKIAAQLQTFEDRSKGESFPPKPRKRHRNRLSFETRPLLYRMTGVDLTKIEGIDETTALIVVGEIGLDMRRWPSEKQCTSWLGFCPRVRVSGGRVLSSRTRPTANRAAAA